MTGHVPLLVALYTPVFKLQRVSRRESSRPREEGVRDSSDCAPADPEVSVVKLKRRASKPSVSDATDSRLFSKFFIVDV